MASRIETFREYMRRLDATAGPREILDLGLYVPGSKRTVADEVAGRLELKPDSTHVVLGGVGSGKTTELMLACDHLNQHDDFGAFYIDISKHRDLQSLTSTDLTNIVLDQLEQLTNYYRWRSGGVNPSIFQDCRAWLSEDPYHHYTNNLNSPYEFLEALIGELKKVTRHIIVVLDSLDRLIDADQFSSIVLDELSHFRKHGIGLVLTAPLAAMYGTARTVLDRFDRFHYHPWVSIELGSDGLDFLVRVLHARVPPSFCPEQPSRRLAALSGGVLRDLVALAQSAVEEAYLDGSDTLTEAHVGIAADTFGRKHLLGLNPEEIEILQRIRRTGTFVQTSDRDMTLLVTRRVLEYHNGRTRYAVHPTIEPLLDQLASP